MTTLRPLGPSVTLTALFRSSTPRSKRSRASAENLISLAAMMVSSSFLGMSKAAARPSRSGCPSGGFLGRHQRLVDDTHQVGFLHDEKILAVDLNFGARPFAE